MRHLLVLLFCCFFIPSNAQEITVLEASSRYPIMGVAIYNASKTKSAISDFDGKVVLDLFNDDETIFFQHVSHITVSFLKRDVPKIVYLERNPQSLDEVVISASKFEQNKKEVPQKVISLKAEEIQFTNPQTSADLLSNSGQVFVQKSQLGGGSPMIRGFSTNRLLLSVDDVRMNNAIFRSGNVQNVISIDPFSVQNTEIILGAGSVIYGSDAIGGVMNFYTKKPQLSHSNELQFNGNVTTRYASANEEKTGHFDLNFGWQKWAFFSSVSYSDFEDLKMGKYGPDDYLRPEYAVRENGQDIVIQNDDPRVQRFTGYDQINVMQKVHYQPSSKLNFDLGIHYSSTSDYPRYDRLIQYRNDQLRSAEWSYGPQRWFMGNFQITKFSSRSNLYDNLKFTTAYQNFQESRIDRDFGSNIRRIREEQVDAFSSNLDLEKTISSSSKFTYGFEVVHNSVHSKGRQENIDTNDSEDIASRYPDASTWQSIAAYFNYKYKPNRKFTMQSGIRYNYIWIKADLNENNQFYNFPFDNADIHNGAFTGSVGLSWVPNKTIQWKLNATTAFRAPNIDDVGKVFDSEPGSVVVPNPNLKPEYSYGGDLGLTLNFGDVVVLDLATYYTYLDNALIREDFSINGETEIIYDGELSNVQAIQNASKAWIYGFEFGANINLTERLSLMSQYSIVGGSEEDDNGKEIPVRHVAPAFGNIHLLWNSDKLKLDAFVMYNGELSFYQLAPSEAEKDFLYAKDKNGNPYAPSWYTLNFRSHYRFSNSFSLIATVENITNQRYRTYSSGIAGAGTNLILSATYNF